MNYLSLAPFKYRDLLKPDNPVFQRISSTNLHEFNNLNDDRYEAFAYLKPEHRPNWLKPSNLYGDPDGTGSAQHRSIACYKAISEGLERWAFYNLVKTPNAIQFGFDIEPSTSGLAAFPGLLKKNSQKLAFFEAVERWTICSWWLGKIKSKQLPSMPFTLDGVELINPWLSEKLNPRVVLIWTKGTEAQIGRRYAFACDSTLERAIFHAVSELRRNTIALRRLHASNNIAVISQPQHSDFFDRRLIYYSEPTGSAEFNEKIKSSLERSGSEKTHPRKIIDKEITGPWSEYATIWRILFEPPTDLHLKESEDFFFF